MAKIGRFVIPKKMPQTLPPRAKMPTKIYFVEAWQPGKAKVVTAGITFNEMSARSAVEVIAWRGCDARVLVQKLTIPKGVRKELKSPTKAHREQYPKPIQTLKVRLAREAAKAA
jgi:hypothetical protein